MSVAHYDWTDYYDIVSNGLDRDVEFYTSLGLEADGTVLDLGCGTGRISIPMALKGIEVVGVDASEKMLEKARAKADMAQVNDKITFIHDDMRTFELGRTFQLAMIPYRSFLHLLSVKEQMAALRQVSKHLAEGGLLALNVFVPTIQHLYEQNEKSSTRGIYMIPGSEDRLVVWDYTRYDHFRQIAEIIRQYERTDQDGVVVQRVVSPLHIRYIFPSELHHLLRLAGFGIVERYGDFSKKAFDSESTELIVIAKKL
ncbi:class I SAM-dependent methyltransferase [Aneurinibacillus aneurinilyticus]|uniref:Methyltransferase domain protein n=1 Tax=Aneurinibacillus aneurinilyticus ATCC 12856 TaxID=649747 RepID=U1WM17_ANEAE|nr:class I SAM-dependent methyltransferase [Aneurinibacillus aneurinilyticus]ERI09639.1 methyltransferase domain protein [Aneurinibacillus aneurinilyticus ATCC 12856]MED0709550.1 class I SAM-dependent methyltransferase [Aneurinibacillus aneurinilyticus]MED0725955.1 class I SAM-dependent methyltransferase [Aneurinibacillus aneurinilyticus]MED0730960.1 class I SAM-dependent methyltransferase [Aneurinibacillus aneurinilyticus]MED0742740.1 class I SAM-dependent methyltransferase [Aneurinibacillus 